jgi:hypothetical protein
MTDLLINLLASVIAGTAVWLAQFVVRRRRLDRERAFFGFAEGETVLLVTTRHASSASAKSVHRRDVAALVELAALARECGARADLIGGGDARPELGRVTEFCVGGPSTNPRTAVHLRAVLRGVSFVSYEPAQWHEGAPLSVTIGPRTFTNTPEDRHAVVARFRPAGGKPVFLIGGLTADGNVAAARYLAAHHRGLLREYGIERSFCLVLRVREPEAYGTDLTEAVADVSDLAFTGPRTGED